MMESDTWWKHSRVLFFVHVVCPKYTLNWLNLDHFPFDVVITLYTIFIYCYLPHFTNFIRLRLASTFTLNRAVLPADAK